MAQTNVQAFSGDVEVASTLTVSNNIVVDDGVYHPLTIDPTSSMIYNKQLYFDNIGADTYNYLGRFSIYAPPAILNIWDLGTALGSGSRYSMSKAWGTSQPPIMNALEGSNFSTYKFYWEPEAAGGASEENIFYHVWFSPSRAGYYIFYIHAKEYLFPTEPSSPTYNDVIYGMLNLLDTSGTQSHVVVGRPNVSGAATLQLHNESQTTGDRLTHEAIQLFSNASPAAGDVSNVFITMTPSSSYGGYGGYIEGWVKSGDNSGLSLGSISSGTKYQGLTVTGTSGNVGIGRSDPSHGRMQIQCSSQTPDGGLTIRGGDFDAGLGAMWVEGSGSGQRFNIQAYKNESTDPPSGVNPSVLDADAYELCLNPKGGNVGIGTNDPAHSLDVYTGTANFTGIQVRTGTNPVAFAKLITNPTTGGHNGIVQAGDLGIVFSPDNESLSDASPKGFYIAPWSSATSGLRINDNGNVGIGTTDVNYRLDLGDNSGDCRLGFGAGIATDNNRGIYWTTDGGYAIKRDSGAWSAPNYAQLRVQWTTGIVIDAGGGTYGRSYVGVNDRMSIGSTYYNSNTKPPDNGLLVEGRVAIGTNTDGGHTLNVNGRAFANHLQAPNYFYVYTNIGCDGNWRTAFNIGTTAIGFFTVLSNNAGYGQPSAIWWYQYKSGGTGGYVSRISGSTTPNFRLSGLAVQSQGSGQQFVQVRTLPVSN